MVGLIPEGPRDRVFRLMAAKDLIENEIREQTLILETNNVGMHDSLVDEQGFPRADIDVYKVRLARHAIICLQNDHKAIMKHIEQGLAEVHAELRSSVTGQGSSNGNAHTNSHIANGHASTNGHGPSNQNSGDDVVSLGPNAEGFAVIAFVQDGSPADLAGLRAQDEILQFGSVVSNNFSDITQIHNVVVHCAGQVVRVKVKRGNTVMSLNVTPRPWGQPGLLGCQINRRV